MLDIPTHVLVALSFNIQTRGIMNQDRRIGSTRRFLLSIAVIICAFAKAQTPNPTINTLAYNYEPQALDGKTAGLQVALSLRKLFVDYDGPLVRLRRASDNAQKDFYPAAVSGILDTPSILEWAEGSNVFCVTWYDQFGNRDATAPGVAQQPQMNLMEIDRPALAPDGTFNANGDRLIIQNANTGQLIGSLGQTTIIQTIRATERSQFNWGVFISNAVRYTGHVNWNNNRLYWDPGTCCGGTRSASNTANENKWQVYTYRRSNPGRSVRAGTNTPRLLFSQAGYNPGAPAASIRNAAWFLFGANGTNTHSNSQVTEFIMYNTSLSDVLVQELEDSAIRDWKLN